MSAREPGMLRDRTAPASPPEPERLTAPRMPAEWEPHERCLMAWPSRGDLWGAELEQAKRDYAAVALAISAHEPVLMFAREADLSEVRAACGAGVDVAAIELDDSWMRDTGPIFVRGQAGELWGMDFVFNGWGQKYTPYAADARIAERALEQLGMRRQAVPLVLEGGAITVDGQGTLITTESVLLNPNRNPELSRAEIEDLLRRHLGAERVIWLGRGLVEDRDTDGHVDNVCHFIGPGRVLAQAVPEACHPNHEAMTENLRRLREARDARGRALEVVEMPFLPYRAASDVPTAVPYMNLYLANGAVIVPVTGGPDDDAALELIAAALPQRTVVPVPGSTLAHGGGGVHCITQQQPAATTDTGSAALP